MAGITLEIAQEMLNSWIEAEKQVMAGQSYSINGKSVTKANLSEIRSSNMYWNKKVRQLTRRKKGKGSMRVTNIVFTD